MDIEKAPLATTSGPVQHDEIPLGLLAPTATTCISIGHSILVILAIANQILFPLDVWLICPENYATGLSGHIIAGVIALIFVRSAQAHPRTAVNELGGLCYFYITPTLSIPIAASLILMLKPENTDLPGLRPGQTIAGISTMAIVTFMSSAFSAVAAPITNAALVDLVTTKTEAQAAKSDWTPWRRRMLYVAFFCKTLLNVIHCLGKDHVFRSFLPAFREHFSEALLLRDLAYYSICGVTAYTILPHRAYLKQRNYISQWLIWPSWTCVRLLHYEKDESDKKEEPGKSTSSIVLTETPKSNNFPIPGLAFITHGVISWGVILCLLPIEVMHLCLFAYGLTCLSFYNVERMIRRRSDMSVWMKCALRLAAAAFIATMAWYDPFGFRKNLESKLAEISAAKAAKSLSCSGYGQDILCYTMDGALWQG